MHKESYPKNILGIYENQLGYHNWYTYKSRQKHVAVGDFIPDLPAVLVTVYHVQYFYAKLNFILTFIAYTCAVKFDAYILCANYFFSFFFTLTLATNFLLRIWNYCDCSFFFSHFLVLYLHLILLILYALKVWVHFCFYIFLFWIETLFITCLRYFAIFAFLKNRMIGEIK